MLTEVAVDDVIAKLKEYMPVRTTMINAEKADEIQIVAPDEINYFGGREADFPTTPAIFVMEGPSRFKQEGPRGLMSEMQVLVYVYDSDQSGQLLRRRLQRQARAVIESLFIEEPRERTANGFNLTPMKTIPGSVFKPEQQHEWRGFYVVVFKIEQLEI